MTVVLPAIGQVLTNAEICATFKVGNSGGMRKSNTYNALILITDPFKAIYEDKWIDGILNYTGMGRIGDQYFDKQNKTLRDAQLLGIKIYLFEAYTPQRYTFLGEVKVCGDIHYEKQPDENGDSRNVLIFPLSLTATREAVPITSIQTKVEILEKAARKRSITQLKKRALVAQGPAGKHLVTANYYDRNPDVSALAKHLANGHCALCDQPAPFLNKNGEPYLETHHIVWLSNGGADAIENTVALCPNCHRKMHAINSKTDCQLLTTIAQRNARNCQA